MKRPQPISPRAKELPVGAAWVVVHSFEAGQIFIETLCEAVAKNFLTFSAVAAEDWQIIGLFASAQEAAAAASAWIRIPGARRVRERAIM